MKKRLTFECWNCHRQFELTLEIESKRYVRECLYCGFDCVFDLGEYVHSEHHDVLRGDSRHDPEKTPLPTVIPTCKPEPEDDDDSSQ